jgi:methionyl-tRNA synthetase
VRTLRQLGEEVVFVCGTDEHGTAITIGAEAAGIPYPDYVARWRAEIKDGLRPPRDRVRRLVGDERQPAPRRR